MFDITTIHYSDIDQSEKKELRALKARNEQINNIRSKARNLTPEEHAEDERISEVLSELKSDGSERCERLFVGLRDLFNLTPGLLGGELQNHESGVLKPFGNDDLKPSTCRTVALTYGLLSIDDALSIAPIVIARHHLKAKPTRQKAEPANDGNPTIARAEESRHIESDRNSPEWSSLSRMFFAAVGEAHSMDKLAELVLPLLAKEGDPDGSNEKIAPTVDAAEFARIMRKLVKDGVTAKEPQLRRRINEALNVVQNRESDGTSNEFGIDLPDLEDAAESGIVPDNVQLMGPMICSAMFDELKVFEVVEKLVELFQQGMLTIGNGPAGKLMYKYWKDAPNRMSESERRNFYAMTMGIPGGQQTGMINREFNDLWLRFVSSVASFVRQNEVDKLLRASLPSPISHQQIRKAARDLAVNLSLHGYGMAFHAALDLQAQIKFMVNLLGDKEVMGNYGARDMWQVVDQVATLELGGAKSSSRYRTLATCGVIITAWLAKNADRIRRPGGPIIDVDEVRQPIPRVKGTRATNDPTDADLVNACLLWLADTATGDTVIDQMAQPRETPVMTSRPVQIPAIAREMLADLPVAGMSYSNGYSHH
jgi:hypothetical protein